MGTRGFTLSGRRVNANVRTVDDEAVRQDNQNTTGVHTGGVMTINGSDPTKIDISAGTGIVIEDIPNPVSPDVTSVVWEAFTSITIDFLLTNFTSYIGINRSGNIVQIADTITARDRRDFIILGLLVHTTNTVIEDVSNTVFLGYGTGSTLVDLISTIGIVNISGNELGGKTGTLSLEKTLGEAFSYGGDYVDNPDTPNTIIAGSLSAPDLFKPYRDGTLDDDGFPNFKLDFPFTEFIDPANYDDGSGTLVAVPASDPWTVQRVYYDPVNNNIVVAYGQFLHKSANGAENGIQGEDFKTNPVLKDALLRAFMVVHRSCLDSTDSSTCIFLEADRFGQVPAGGSSTRTFAGIIQGVVAETGDFAAEVGTSYTIDNTSTVNVTLPQVTPANTGAKIEFWILKATTTNNVTLTAFDFDHIINGVIGVDPDPAVGTINSTTTTYIKVVCRLCTAKSYIIDHIDTVTT